MLTLIFIIITRIRSKRSMSYVLIRQSFLWFATLIVDALFAIPVAQERTKFMYVIGLYIVGMIVFFVISRTSKAEKYEIITKL